MTDDSQFVDVLVQGVVQTGMMAMGGETTGVIISAANIQWELEADASVAEQLAGHDGQVVLVRGRLRRVPGVEMAERWIVKVSEVFD